MKNNNPFNIRRNDNNKWVGKIADNKEPFEKFETMDYGVRAGLKLLRNYYTKYDGLNTVYNIIHKFAPPFENNTDTYIKHVCTYTGFKPNQVLDLMDKDTLLKLATEIVAVETGKRIDPAIFERVYETYFANANN